MKKQINQSENNKTSINTLPSLNLNFHKNKIQQNNSIDIISKGNLIKNMFSTSSGSAITNLINYLKSNSNISSNEIHQIKAPSFLSYSMKNLNKDKIQKEENNKPFKMLFTEEKDKVEPLFSKYIVNAEEKIKNMSNIPSVDKIQPVQTKLSYISPKKSGSLQYFSPKKTQSEPIKLVNFCPYCEHCNSVENQGSLPYSINNRGSNEPSDTNEKDKAYSNLNQTSKNILNKALDYILNMNDLPDFNFFSKKKIEIFQNQIKNFPKVEYQNRILYNGVGTFLLALSEGKVNIDDFLSFENKEKLLSSFLATGLAYGYANTKENNHDFQIMLKNADDEEDKIKINLKKKNGYIIINIIIY